MACVRLVTGVRCIKVICVSVAQCQRMIDLIYQALVLPNLKKTERRVENTICSRVFLKNFNVLRNVVEHCLSVKYSSNSNFNYHVSV